MLGRALEKVVNSKYELEMQLLLELLQMNNSTFYFTDWIKNHLVSFST
jgi:hypothetical protein